MKARTPEAKLERLTKPKYFHLFKSCNLDLQCRQHSEVSQLLRGLYVGQENGSSTVGKRNQNRVLRRLAVHILPRDIDSHSSFVPLPWFEPGLKPATPEVRKCPLTALREARREATFIPFRSECQKNGTGLNSRGQFQSVTCCWGHALVHIRIQHEFCFLADL